MLGAESDVFKANPGASFRTDKLFPQGDRLLAIGSMYKENGIKVATGYHFMTPNSDGLFNYMAASFEIVIQTVLPLNRKPESQLRLDCSLIDHGINLHDFAFAKGVKHILRKNDALPVDRQSEKSMFRSTVKP